MNIEQHDEILGLTKAPTRGLPAFIHIRETLAAPDGIAFPPTYADPKDGKKESPGNYTFDVLRPGFPSDEAAKQGVVANIVALDSVGSQAGRIEAQFLADPDLAKLMPQITITKNGERHDLLELSHRLADGAIIASTFIDKARTAMTAALDGDVEQVAQLSPMSIVFGLWDSRKKLGATELKLPRILHSEIYAENVALQRRSAQFVSAWREDQGRTDAEARAQAAAEGEADIPSTGQHGGVRIFGQIVRRVVIDLVQIRALNASNPDRTHALRRYIFGLAQLGAVAQEHYRLRQGCWLRRMSTSTALIRNDRDDEPIKAIDYDRALKFAQAAARDFFGPEGPRSAQHQYSQEKKAAIKEQANAKRNKKVKVDNAAA